MGGRRHGPGRGVRPLLRRETCSCLCREERPGDGAELLGVVADGVHQR